jgi:C4-dicarboxylate-specific signal transduction histidine kinase
MQNAIKSKSEQSQNDNDREMGRTTEATSTQIAERVQALSKDTITSARIRVAVMALVIMLVSCGIGSLIALITAGRIVRPVIRLAQAAHAIAAGDLQRRVDAHAPDEVGDLASAFNTMADSLQSSRADLNEAEGQLVQSAKLAALGTLSAGVAHELNQPVAIIRGIAQQLKQEEGFADDLKADIDIIEGQTGRMTKIIRHLRTFCRAGGAEFTEVDVHRTLQDCLLLIGEQLRTHNIEVEFQLCDAEPMVTGDANELEQVFLNLITNARDAMDGRASARITIGSYVRDSQLTIEFRDNGPGIPAEVFERIFDPFFTTKEAGKGTGLGLSISHTIIAKHHGELRAHNSNGAVFSIVLPLESGEQIQALKAA